MGKINLLDSSVYNHISAGEVVTNPSAVVKELVENSIDAGADKITIEVEGGGITKIRVIDNGSGMEKDDVKKAFLSHATSKISNIDDIFHISTLGFRGEALASIGAVSKANIVTKTRDTDTGVSLSVEGGVFGDVTECASTDGTSVTVTNLFYNTPARLKFLKATRFEQSDINKVVSRFILGHPQISFTYLVDGELFYQSSSGTLFDAIYSVYGAEFLQEMFSMDIKENGIHLSGYICTPLGTKNSNSWQNTFVNGRWVESKSISTACFNAYSNYVMKNKYPSYILNIEIDPRDVDINVSPQKTEAKFVRDVDVLNLTYKGVALALAKHEKEQEEKENVERLGATPTIDKDEKVVINANSFNPNLFECDKPSEKPISVTVEEQPESHLNDTTVQIFEGYNEVKKVEDIKPVSKIVFNSPSSVMSEVMKMEADKIHKTLSQSTFLEEDEPFKIVGVAFTTYIIVESGEQLYFIDQHAAHERVLYDKFVAEVKSGDVHSQPLLIPFTLNTSYAESEFLEKYKSELSSMGFEIDVFGNNAYKISAVPEILSDLDLNIFFRDIFSELNYLTNQNELIKDKIATKACRSAIKAGDKIGDDEIALLIKMVNSSDSPLQCPHGRPFVVKVTKTELEKWFKRIVC